MYKSEKSEFALKTLKDNNNEKYFYLIKNFQIPYEDYILLNKTYDYINSDSKLI